MLPEECYDCAIDFVIIVDSSNDMDESNEGNTFEESTIILLADDARKQMKNIPCYVVKSLTS